MLSQDTKDTFKNRWGYFPKLILLIWRLGQKKLFIIIAFALVNGIIPVFMIDALRKFIDNTIQYLGSHRVVTDAIFWLGILLLITFFQHIMLSFSQWMEANIRDQMKAKAQEELLLKTSKLPLSTFENSEFYDRLQRAERGLEQRLLVLMAVLFEIPPALVTIISLSVYIGSANFWFPVILLVGLVPLYIARTKKLRERFQLDKKQTPSERMLSYLDEMISSRQSGTEVRIFGLQKYLIDKRQTLFSQLRDHRMNIVLKELKSQLIWGVWVPITIVIVIAGAMYLIANGTLTIGFFTAYYMALTSYVGRLEQLFVNISFIDSDLRYIRDIIDYLSTDEESRTGNERSIAETNSEDFIIKFEEVSFSYSGESKVLKDIVISLKKGETVALVGENGSGKSTLSNLLLGLYQPTEGKITINGKPIHHIENWRDNTSAVLQKYVRYDLTLRENIGYGDLTKLWDVEAINQAAIKSGANEVTESLPNGIETFLGKTFDEKGEDLSGGQWQKLAIARAYIRNAGILVLDEPTAAVDPKTEVEVYKRFKELTNGRTVLLISHRLGSARIADKILVLEKGEIVEEGTHEQLMLLQGRYANMFTIQSQWYS